MAPAGRREGGAAGLYRPAGPDRAMHLQPRLLTPPPPGPLTRIEEELQPSRRAARTGRRRDSSCTGPGGRSSNPGGRSCAISFRPTSPTAPNASKNSSASSAVRSSGHPGAPAAQRGRTRLTATSSGAQSGADKAPERSRAGTSQPVLPVRRWTARRAGPHADLTMVDTSVLRRS